MIPNEIRIAYSLTTKRGVDHITTDKTVQLVAEQWVQKMRRKFPTLGWSVTSRLFTAEARSNDGQWAYFSYSEGSRDAETARAEE